MTQPRISVLIINWRSKDYVRRCLDTVRATCADLAPEIIVVDSGSFDACGEMLASRFPEVEFIQAPDNFGFGRSNNLGFERVKGQVLLLLNPDTELKPGAVQHLFEELQRRPHAGILGPRLLNTDGSLQTSCVQSLPTPWNRALDSGFLRRLLPKSQLWGAGQAFHSASPVEVQAVSGACMLLRSEVFRQVGGFSPEFFMYGEDVDLCYKVRELGFTVCHVPMAEVIHHGGGSSKMQVSHYSAIMICVAGETYMRRNHGRSAAFWYRVLQALSALARLFLLVLACVLRRGSDRVAARLSLAKWWFVLQWAVGASPVNTRPQPIMKSDDRPLPA